MPLACLIGRQFVKGLGTMALIFFTSCGGDSSNPNSPPQGGQQPGTVPAATVDIPVGAVGLGTAAYGVNPLIVAAGTVVTWVNNDVMPHTTTSDTGIWDSGLLQPGQSFSFQFNSGGNFPYHCAIHGAANMSGMIQVTGPTASPTPSTSPTPLSPTYRNVTNAVLVPHCMSCHEGASPSAGLDFTTHQNLVQNPVLPNLVVPGQPNQSRLFLHIQGDASAVGQEFVTQTEIQLVSDWIKNGALDN